MFDFANKGKTTMNPDEIMLMIRCSMKGLCRVKAMEEPPEEYYHGLLRGTDRGLLGFVPFTVAANRNVHRVED